MKRKEIIKKMSDTTYNVKEAYKVGETEFEQDMGDKCPDCGQSNGEYHLDGCDIERCPFCELQLISCDCDIVITGGEK